MPTNSQPQVSFTQGAADKIVTAVKRVLAAPTDGTGSRVQSRVNDNRVFWARLNESEFTEVYQTSAGEGGLTWTDMPGGRSGSFSDLSMGAAGSAASKINPPFIPQGGIFLVFQWFDAGTIPPTAYYAALGDSNCIVKITGNASVHNVYEGYILSAATGFGSWNSATSVSGTTSFSGGNSCLIVNLEELDPNLASPSWMLDSSVAQYCTGIIVSSTAAGMPIVCITNGTYGHCIANGSSTALATTDNWKLPAGVSGSNTYQGFNFDVVTDVTLSGSTLTVHTRTIYADSRGRLYEVSAQS